MRLGASAYLAHASLAEPTFAAAAEAGATLAFTSLHVPEDSPAGARAAATAIVSAATSSGLSVMADVSPNTARLLGDSPWEFLRSIGVARVRIDFGFSVAEIRSIAAVLPIALNASTLRAADLAPFAHLDVETHPQLLPAGVDRAGAGFCRLVCVRCPEVRVAGRGVHRRRFNAAWAARRRVADRRAAPDDAAVVPAARARRCRRGRCARRGSGAD
ncbi:MupG family TIM beta-alpha barrel fold protein [Curtobacterium sp. ZW137]|uniref:MupG family TIM beta-alpha barrel fold protein n=1 Tax=Curtobacterium sp. ZW137 TaxID=2485104 RepID=UPI000F4C62E0